MNYRQWMGRVEWLADDCAGQVRMGTGKGSFDHWASRVPIGRVIFELKGEVHEELVKDAFRVACNKMPGTHPPPLCL